MEQY